MKWTLSLFCAFLFSLASISMGGDEEAQHDAVTLFRTASLFIQTQDEPLVAYQVEIEYDQDLVKIVGLEGGQGPFNGPPFYDPAGMAQGRIIVAAFITDDALAPRGSIYVARLHLRIQGDGAVELRPRVMTAAAPGGGRISATAEIVVEERSGS